MSKNYYDILGVQKNATKEEIRSKYIKLIKKYHPDINSDKNSTSRVQEINVAYDVLSDNLKRKKYNQSLNKKVEKQYFNEEKERLEVEMEQLIAVFRSMKIKMESGPEEIITLKEMKNASARYNILKNKLEKLNIIKEKINVPNRTIKYRLDASDVKMAYMEILELRKKHIENFFDNFTKSSKRNTVKNLIIHENIFLSTICLLNTSAAALLLATNNQFNNFIPTAIVLNCYNIIDLKKKYKINKQNYTKGMMIINRDNETKKEYNTYCLNRKIKNKSIQ